LADRKIIGGLPIAVDQIEIGFCFRHTDCLFASN
jgi:hypothetical protein